MTHTFDTTTTRSFKRSFRRMGFGIATIILWLGLTPAALATTVQIDPFKMTDNPIADFGSGGHHNFVPDGNATVTWDYTPNANGVMIAKATVNGRLYLDTLGAGTVRLMAEYRSGVSGSAPLVPFHEIGRVNAGGSLSGANGASHQDDVIDFHSSQFLNQVVLQLQELRSGQFQNVGTRKFLNVKNLQRYGVGIPVIIDNSPRRFVGEVQIRRVNGDMTARIAGSIISTDGSVSLSRLRVEYLDINNTILDVKTINGPITGFTLDSDTPDVRGRLWKVRLKLGTQVLFSQSLVGSPTVRTFDFLGNVS